ncbi:MAG: holo-ACP synthase [Gemmatimonas sp.]|nr:holo-ACP synthase [Gemmatimonas sp.]
MIIGIGIDFVEVERIARLLLRYPDRASVRLFTDRELSHCRSTHSPAESYAARFAAKEAVFKALGTGWSCGVTWHDAEVIAESSGAPCLLLHGEAGRLAGSRGVRRAHLSLTHTRTLAGAYVVLEGR